MTQHAYAPQTLRKDKTTIPPSSHKIVPTIYTQKEWEPRDSAPHKRSHVDALRSTYCSRLRVIAKACTPKTSRTHNTFDWPSCLKTATTRSAPAACVATRNYCSSSRKSLAFPNELQHTLSACKLKHVSIFTRPCLLNTTDIRNGCKHDNSCCVQVR